MAERLEKPFVNCGFAFGLENHYLRFLNWLRPEPSVEASPSAGRVEPVSDGKRNAA
jgi:hypothetical protein